LKLGRVHFFFRRPKRRRISTRRSSAVIPIQLARPPFAAICLRFFSDSFLPRRFPISAITSLIIFLRMGFSLMSSPLHCNTYGKHRFDRL